jgi:hypothetical protein
MDQILGSRPILTRTTENFHFQRVQDNIFTRYVVDVDFLPAKKPPGSFGNPGASRIRSGDTYSRTFGTTIGSESLTTVFGMGTGVAFQIWSPESGGGRFEAPARRL